MYSRLMDTGASKPEKYIIRGVSTDFLEITLGEITMSNRILVAYASRAGSTAGVAEAIGKALANGDIQVDVRPMQEIEDLTPYRAVVAGSAIQKGRWLPEAMQFIQAHQAELAQKPFAAFLVCMTLAMPNNKYREQVADWLKPVSALVRPVSEGLFAGVLDISKIPSFRDRLNFRLSVALGVWSEGDHRDWNAIRAWAESIRPLLLQ
jgi:menaquinone-dependent protoporphyrinogen oxidase